MSQQCRIGTSSEELAAKELAAKLGEGDPYTLCNSPRCSLGEGHTLPCDTKAQAPA